MSLYFSQFGMAEEFDDQDETSSLSATGYDLSLGLGYTFSPGIYLGAKYFMNSSTTTTESKMDTGAATLTSVDSESATISSGYGLSLGYYSSIGLHITGTYLIAAVSETKSEAKAKFCGRRHHHDRR